jgi:hypothetical protein
MIEDIPMNTTKLVSQFSEVNCNFYGFYKLELCACAVIIGHSELRSEPSDKHRLLSGFGYNSIDTLPK